MQQRNEILDYFGAFYPIACVVVFVPLTTVIGHPWIGIVLFIVIHYLWKTWWTCIFGLMNAMALWGGIAGCVIPYIRMLHRAMTQ